MRDFCHNHGRDLHDIWNCRSGAYDHDDDNNRDACHRGDGLYDGNHVGACICYGDDDNDGDVCRNGSYGVCVLYGSACIDDDRVSFGHVSCDCDF